MIATLFKDFTFDAAHRLPRVPEGHKCGRLHGHTYHLRVWVRGDIDPATGWVIDLAAIKAIVQDRVLSRLDHRDLNDLIENPTVENIAIWVLEILRHTELHRRPHLEVSGLELRETDSAGVSIT